MVPGSLETHKPIDWKAGFKTFKGWIRRYFWLWIAYQTIKGLATTTLIWVPIAYMYLAR